MKLSSISPRDRRVLVLGAAAIAALLITGRGIPAWMTWNSEARATARETHREASRARASVQGFRAVRDSLAARKQRLVALVALVVRGETPAMAGASLAAIVTAAASEASIRLGAVQVRSDSAGHGLFTRVAVRADAVGDVEGISSFLSALESESALLTIREFAVSQSEPAAPPDRVEALRIDLTVEALMLSPVAPKRDRGSSQ